MKILKISEKSGLFFNPLKIDEKCLIEEQYKSIETITKEDIMDILDYMIDNDAEFDSLADNELPNPAQATIYNSLIVNFQKIKLNKEQIKKEVDNAFLEAEQTYCK